MNSATDLMNSDSLNEGHTGSWEPSATCYVTPTLVIICGSMRDDEARAIRKAVEGRLLRPDFPLSALRWGQLQSAKEVSKRTIDQMVAPLLERGLWDRLEERRYVADRRLGERLPLQIIAVCDPADIPEEEASRLLQKLPRACANSLKGRADFSLVLIALGDAVPDVGKVKQYWPRIRMQRATYDGAAVTRARVIEACQTLIASLLTSELVRAIDHVCGSENQSIGWIPVGASALTVDLTQMRDYLRLLILRELMQPLIPAVPTDSSRELVPRAMKKKVRGFQSATLAQALSIASGFSWDSERDATHVATFTLSPEAELRAKIDEPPEDEDELVASLQDHYVILREALVENLAKTVNEQYDRLLVVFGFLLDRSAPTHRDEGSPLSLQEDWPSGLPAAMHGIETATVELKGSPDLNFEKRDVLPHPMGDDYFLTTVAESDASNVYAGLWRRERFARTISSPMGIALMLIPAWPLLTSILTTVIGWGERQAALVAALALSALGGIEWIVWWQLRKRHREKIRRQLMRRIADSVLRLMTKVLGDYRVLAVRGLQDALFALRGLFRRLHDADRDAQIRLDQLDSQYHAGSKNGGGVYKLVAFDTCRGWADQAIREADADETRYDTFATGLLIDNVFPLLREPSSPRGVIRKLEQAADHLAEGSFNSDVLEAYVLAEREQNLTGGLRWQWLHQRAHPLGGGGGPGGRPFTVMTMASEAALVGASGQSSPYWQAGWLVARSRQRHGLICVRGIVEGG